MTAEEIKTTLKTYNLQSWSKQKGLNPIPVEKGEGIYFWDYDGNRYTDMSSQLVKRRSCPTAGTQKALWAR